MSRENERLRTLSTGETGNSSGVVLICYWKTAITNLSYEYKRVNKRWPVPVSFLFLLRKKFLFYQRVLLL